MWWLNALDFTDKLSWRVIASSAWFCWSVAKWNTLLIVWLWLAVIGVTGVAQKALDSSWSIHLRWDHGTWDVITGSQKEGTDIVSKISGNNSLENFQFWKRMGHFVKFRKLPVKIRLPGVQKEFQHSSASQKEIQKATVVIPTQIHASTKIDRINPACPARIWLDTLQILITIHTVLPIQ